MYKYRFVKYKYAYKDFSHNFQHKTDPIFIVMVIFITHSQ